MRHAVRIDDLPKCKVPVGLVPALEEAGLACVDVLTAAGLPTEVFATVGYTLPVDQYLALWRAIGEQSGRPSIGIELAASIKPDFTEPLFLAFLGAANLGEALTVLARYKRLLNPEAIELHRDRAERALVVSYRWPNSGLSLPDALVDAELAFVVELARRATRCPELRPRAIRVRAPKLIETSAHAAYFRCPILLGSDDYGLSFDEDACARPFLTHNPELTSVLVPYLQSQAPTISPAELARVRATIAERLRVKRPSLRVVGKALGMSERSLQRLLERHGTTFRKLLDEVRDEQAHQYLRAGSLSDLEIAFLLGFEDPSSFYRAFRARHDMSPSEFRRATHLNIAKHSAR